MATDRDTDVPGTTYYVLRYFSNNTVQGVLTVAYSVSKCTGTGMGADVLANRMPKISLDILATGRNDLLLHRGSYCHVC